MKRLIITVFALALTSVLFAQNSKTKLFGMPLKRTGVSLGIEWDRVQNFSAVSFERMAGLPSLSDDLGLDADQADIYSGYCENPHLRLQAAWLTANPKVELHTSLLVVANRYDGLTFYGESLSRYDNYLTMNSWGNEIALDVALVRRLEAGPFALHVGVGGNTGYSFLNTIDITGTLQAESSISSLKSSGIGRLNSSDYGDFHIYDVEVGDGITQRVYGQLGWSVTIAKRVEIGMEGRWGYGYRWHFDGSPISTNLRSLGGIARWVLK